MEKKTLKSSASQGGPGFDNYYAATFRAAGAALFGSSWQTEMGRQLETFHPERKPVPVSVVHRWAAGGRTVPLWVFAGIVRLAARKSDELDRLAREIDAMPELEAYRILAEEHDQRLESE